MLECYKNYSFLLGDSLYPSIALLMLCIFLISKLYLFPAAKDREQIFWGAVLIISSTVLAFGLTFIGEEVQIYLKNASLKCGAYLLGISISIEYSKYIISFGLAAIGAGISANVLTERFSMKKLSLIEKSKFAKHLNMDSKKITEREKFIKKSDEQFKNSLK